MKIHILKLTNRDELNEDPQYYTIKSLRERVLLDWYDIWGEMHYPHKQDYTKEQVAESDNDLLDWLSGWGYDTEIIYTITENDL